ncbi:MAG: PQQ-binding-like beta-propeller repeat protein [Verrucomicrobiae bacterium]|nr:PQQ-binding-like beta-propeller repeat protein [Verrucomicrobiae bacterium]
MKTFSPTFFVTFGLAVASLHAQNGEAQKLLDLTTTTGGLVVHVGCGDGALAASLAEARDSLVVQGLETDAAKVVAARGRFRESESGATRLSAELWNAESGRLPFAENLVNLLIVSEGVSIADDEVMRVLRPGGSVARASGGGWKTETKPEASTKRDWTHYEYNASNNMVGEDPDCGLPRRFQWAGKPLWTTSHENMSSVNAMVSAKGRVFAIVDEGPRASVQLPADWELVARDGYNGVVLWKKPMTQWLTRFWPWKSGPAQMPRKLVAVGDRVYAPLDINGPLIQFDAATGEELRVYDGTAAAEEIVYLDGVVLVVANPDPSNQAELEEERRKRRNFSYDGRDHVVIDHGKAKRVVAIEAESGKQLWERLGPKVAPLSLGARDGRVVYHDGQQIVCLDLKTGEEKWKSESIPEPLTMIAEESPTLVIGENAVFYARAQKMTAVSFEDGHTLWRSAWPTDDYRSPVTVMLMHDKVWSMNVTSAKAPGTFTGRDPLTGQIETQFDLPPFQGIGHHRCYKAKASGDFVLLSRSGVEYVNPDTQSYAENHWIRGACLYGIMPANGMLYSTPHACACYIKGKLNGFTAMTPGPTTPSLPPMKDESPHEKGGAWPAKSGVANAAGDWPTYRHDVERTGGTDTAVKPELKQSWKSVLGGDLSSITVAEGKVFVSQRDRNTVLALDAETGDVAWRFTAGGMVDSPPTVDSGFVFFGSADGCVYSLRAADGALAWRTRAAPGERQVIAYGRVESAWPVNGSALVQDGAVYAAAGRSSFLDGGITMVKIDQESGKIIGSYTVYDFDSEGKQPPLTGSFDMEGALPDILSGDGKQVYMRHLGFDQETLSPGEPAPHAFSPTGFLDDNWWHRTYWVYGDDTKGGYGGWWQKANQLPAGRLLVFDQDKVYAFGRSFYAGMNSAQFSRGEKYILYASEKRAGPDPDYSIANQERRRNGDLGIDWEQFRTTPIQWQEEIPFHVRAMARAGSTVFAAGPYGDAVRSMESFEGKRGGRIGAADTNSGEMLASYAVDSIPVFDGLVAANGSLFMAMKDGSVRRFGAAGQELPSTLGEPVEIIHEELEESDEAYRKEWMEKLGRNPDGGNDGKRGGKNTDARRPLKGKDRSAEFDTVTDGKVVASELGYRLGADPQKVGLALQELDQPVTGKASWHFQMQGPAEFGQPAYYRNGFLVFGDGAEEAKLVKAGIQFVQGKAVVFEGAPPGKGVKRADVTGDVDRVFEVNVAVDLEKQEVVLEIGGKKITRPLTEKLAKISHAGFATWNAVTDFSPLERVGD